MLAGSCRQGIEEVCSLWLVMAAVDEQAVVCADDGVVLSDQLVGAGTVEWDRFSVDQGKGCFCARRKNIAGQRKVFRRLLGRSFAEDQERSDG
ncbi:hypothetical protein ACQ86N_26130 [Puia sp. P3]|uniref:hypothetical protein n=1 Tax=Puia sp. P3 TaxID=3423952 RepID=UPI003D674ACD